MREPGKTEGNEGNEVSFQPRWPSPRSLRYPFVRRLLLNRANRLLPTHSHRRSEISVVGQLLEHEIGDIGARDAVRPKKVAQVRPVTITAARRAIRQHRGPDNHPIDASFYDQFFLPRFVPENEGQNQRDDEERVK